MNERTVPKNVEMAIVYARPTTLLGLVFWSAGVLGSALVLREYLGPAGDTRGLPALIFPVVGLGLFLADYSYRDKTRELLRRGQFSDAELVQRTTQSSGSSGGGRTYVFTYAYPNQLGEQRQAYATSAFDRSYSDAKVVYDPAGELEPLVLDHAPGRPVVRGGNIELCNPLPAFLVRTVPYIAALATIAALIIFVAR